MSRRSYLSIASVYAPSARLSGGLEARAKVEGSLEFFRAAPPLYRRGG
jgi:hypothetical protein